MAAEPPALRLRPPGSTGDNPPVSRLLGGCVPLSHQVAGHMYGKDKVGECGLGSPSPVLNVFCPGSPRPPPCPAPAVPGLRCPQPRWYCGISRRYPYSHWSPLSLPRAVSGLRITVSAVPSSSVPTLAVPGLPSQSQLSTVLLFATRQSPTPGVPQPRVTGSRCPESPLSLGVGSRAPPGAATGF